MNRHIETYAYPDGEIERVEVVRGFCWNDLSFVTPPFRTDVIREFARLYRCCIIPKCPEAFGTLVFFHIPDGSSLSLSDDGDGEILYDTQVKALRFFNRLRERGAVSDDVRFSDEMVQREFDRLRSLGFIHVEAGIKDELSFLPVTGGIGFLSDLSCSSLVANANFFLMDFADCDAPYDVYGTPYGLMVRDGVMLSPPLYGREALAVDKGGKVKIIYPSSSDFSVMIDGVSYENGNGCVFRCRPDEYLTPCSQGSDIVVVGDRVVAVHDGGGTVIPMAGFVVASSCPVKIVDTCVHYHGFEQYRFAIQVGPCLLKEGHVATTLSCPFFHQGGPVPFPPTVYPLSFKDGKAARIGLGSDWDDEPVLLWAEGAGKNGYVKGRESAGVSLSEFADICKGLGLKHLINLDGGGSAQVVHDGERDLLIADRYHGTNAEAERPVPNGLWLGGVSS